MRQRLSILVLSIPTVIALCFVFGYALTYLTADPGQFGIYRPRHQWLYVHILAGVLALLSGPTQLWLGLNRKTAIVHRIVGILYILSVGVSATTAFYLATHTDFGWVFGLGLFSMALAWVISTALASIAICLRRVEQHREWMIRSYVVTFAFVTFRVMDAVLDTARVGTIVERMTAASWLAWTLPLMITESILQAHKIFGKPPASAQVSAPLISAVSTSSATFELSNSESSYHQQAR